MKFTDGPLGPLDREAAYQEYQNEVNPQPAYYGRIVDQGDYKILQYWFFYAFNEWHKHGGWNDHEGDWEVVMVFLDAESLEPRYVAYSAHDLEGVEIRRTWREIKDDPQKVENGTHPVVYVAAGSHANYFEAGDHPNISIPDFGLFTDRTSRNEEKKITSGAWPLRIQWKNNELPLWLTDYPGLWGRKIDIPGFSGPKGPYYPHPNPTWEDSLAWADIRRPVIVIPGLLGSTLDDNIGEWLVDPVNAEWPASVISGNPQNLQFNEDGTPRTDTNSANLIPTDFIDGYPGISGFYDNFVNFLTRPENAYIKGDFTIFNGTDISPEQTLFKFPYDWRQSVQYNAPRLVSTIQQIKTQTGAAKVDLVAHSMGGMVAIEAIKLLGQSDDVGKLIMVGTPHLGAPQALAALRYGKLDLPSIVDEKAKRAAHNMPGIYDSLPSRNYVESGRQYFRWNHELLNYQETQVILTTIDEIIPPLLDTGDPQPQRRLSETILKQSETFHDGYDNWTKPNNTQVYIIAGYGQSTPYEVEEYQKGNGYKARLLSCLEGDGTVPLASATAMKETVVDRIYYADLKGIGKKHSQMLSGDEIQTLILSLLNDVADVNLSHIMTNPPASQSCKMVEVASPVRLDVYDSQGRHTGIEVDGLVETEIPGSSFYEIGGAEGSKFVTVPDNGDYQVVITALHEGTFDLRLRRSTGETINQTVIYENVEITSTTIAKLDSGLSSEDLMLKIDLDGNGIFETERSPDQIFDGPEPPPVPSPVDATSRVRVDASIAGYNRHTGDTTVNLTVTNTSGDAIRNPITVVFNSFSDAAIKVTNPDGQTDAGKDFVDFSALIPDGELSLGEVTPIKQVKLINPNKARLDFQVSVFGVVNNPNAAPPLKPQFAQPIHLVIPLETALAQNYPNPFNPETWIPFDLAEPGQVTIEIYDIRGHQVRALHLGWLPVGSYVDRDKAAHWDGRNDVGERVASGVYFYRFLTPTFQRTKRMVILK